MECRLASIDVGSHTARLLVVQVSDKSLMETLARDRAYIHLAGHISEDFPKVLRPEAAQIVGRALVNFQEKISSLEGKLVFAAATGLIRETANRKEFIDKVYDISGILIRPIDPEVEALLSAKGALTFARGGVELPATIFDLGGGSTEFCFITESGHRVTSLALGAGILTHDLLRSDPPLPGEVQALRDEITRVLVEGIGGDFKAGPRGTLIGTGGTVVSLAALGLGIGVEDISADKINGQILQLGEIESLAERLSKLGFSEMAKLKGLDKGRAQVVVAGAWAVYHIIKHLGYDRLYVSMHDLLEGMVLEFLEGEGDGGERLEIGIDLR